MKLSLMTWDIARDAPLDEILALGKGIGLPGVEFRAGAGMRHGVEIERTPAERAEIRRRMSDAGVAVAGIATGCEFHFADPSRRREEADRAKRHVDLAADLGAPQIRVFANDLPEGHTREEIVGWVAECLREVGLHGEKQGVRVNLELHGKFRDPVLCLGAVERSACRNVGIVYNSNVQDIQGGSIREAFGLVAPRVRHVHLHEFGGDAGFPYPELFGLLVAAGYDGWCSCEVARLDLKSFLSVYQACFEAYLQIARAKAKVAARKRRVP